jgi:hypothetical protein
MTVISRLVKIYRRGRGMCCFHLQNTASTFLWNVGKFLAEVPSVTSPNNSILKSVLHCKDYAYKIQHIRAVTKPQYFNISVRWPEHLTDLRLYLIPYPVTKFLHRAELWQGMNEDMAWYCIPSVHIHWQLHTCSVDLQQNMTFMYFYKQLCK